MEELEKINAYPPRFFLTFRSGGSIQHLSTNIVVQIGKPKQKLRSKHDETEVLDFPINTLDYVDFMKILSVPSSSKPGTLCNYVHIMYKSMMKIVNACFYCSVITLQIKIGGLCIEKN